MKKLVLSVAIASVLGLTACDDESIKDVQNEVVENGSAVTPTARVKFNPSAGAAGLSIPNDLIFSGTVDGTLEIPVADPTDGSDPFVAISALDGWSISQPFPLGIEFPAGTSLDAASASEPASVRVFETIMGGDANDSDCTAVTRGLACKVVGELVFMQDFVTQKSGDNVLFIPIQPLKAETTYVMVMTNNLRDNNGKAIAGSTTYELARQDINTLPLGNASQLGLQAAINSYEAAVVAAGVSSDTIVYTAAMTTQSTTRVLSTVKSLMAAGVPQMVANAQQGIPAIGVADTGISVANVLTGLIPESLIPLYSAANYIRGSITLPYYSGVPSAENPLAPVNDWWRARCDSGATLAGLAAANPAAIPADALDANDGFCMNFGLRDLSSSENPGLATLDTERNLTKFNPIPATSVMMPIDVQMTTPDLAWANPVRASMDLEPLVEPANGWPVAILVHGITSTKEQMLPITGILSLFGIATVAIDQPLHGSRGFDLDGDGTDEINTSTVSTLHYVNLGSMLSMRDNTRQSTADLLGLRLGMNFLGGADSDGNPIKIDSSKVHLLGHSLGGIYGMNAVGLANTELNPQIDGLFKIASTSLAMPGLMLANFGLDSPAFEGLAKSNLTMQLSPDFAAAVAATLPADYTQAELSAFYFAFYDGLSIEQKATLNAGFAQFTFAAQTVTDSGDPIAYVQALAATQTPTHFIEVVGDGADNLSDQTVTNRAPFTPMGGTEPAIALLGLEAVSETTAGSGVVRFVHGHHSSILDPRANAASPDAALSARATQEMQSQVAVFFATMGQLIQVTDTGVVK
ncbi:MULTISPECIES: VolA/Pla-1 family phospholipase [unclassified Colwellia]|jgi:Pla-1/cef family extracellular lipase|uniref:VolA/Pla-1 family phospholipase n=1 Tax=unclassified Colwellia TaxID=196834 RepID=UPI0015F57B88|nr:MULTISPECIES: VolA/Pla-1 family phospholipase [unclassified Colwellia]MBA6364615.1 alpha/beta fold hydrolase [Colwellia sp. BRX8-8]MBA6357347.1 alpha/beta fold hydrolase [Colwellia sp. BRX8-3]MBA6359567.1 alpha/beta fold hydrolase [Colwellia sp. BRX8-6]MBA6367448.1 alpha/beta fold hydrolase [Colwellia sp. BRX8-5]MBA6371367.1 alpha/beta fold hydrolase [Colwellia sp. BRX8-4]